MYPALFTNIKRSSCLEAERLSLSLLKWFHSTLPIEKLCTNAFQKSLSDLKKINFLLGKKSLSNEMNIYRNLACSCCKTEPRIRFCWRKSTETPEIVLEVTADGPVKPEQANYGCTWSIQLPLEDREKKKVGGPAFSSCSDCKAMRSMSLGMRCFSSGLCLFLYALWSAARDSWLCRVLFLCFKGAQMKPGSLLLCFYLVHI